MPSGLCLCSRLLTFNTYAFFLQTDRGPSPLSSLQQVWRHPCLIQISRLWKHHPADLKAMWRGRWRWRQPPFVASVTLFTAGPALSSSTSEQITGSNRPPTSQNNSKMTIEFWMVFTNVMLLTIVLSWIFTEDPYLNPERAKRGQQWGEKSKNSLKWEKSNLVSKIKNKSNKNTPTEKKPSACARHAFLKMNHQSVL